MFYRVALKFLFWIVLLAALMFALYGWALPDPTPWLGFIVGIAAFIAILVLFTMSKGGKK